MAVDSQVEGNGSQVQQKAKVVGYAAWDAYPVEGLQAWGAEAWEAAGKAASAWGEASAWEAPAWEESQESWALCGVEAVVEILAVLSVVVPHQVLWSPHSGTPRAPAPYPPTCPHYVVPAPA